MTRPSRSVDMLRRRSALAALVLLGSPTIATAQGDATLDPKTYRAPAGEYELFVDPSQPSGAGPASYRFTRKGVELWSGERPWTLWSAEVTDGGLVAGYAYAAGVNGGENDALVLVLLDASGKARLEERTPREGRNGMDSSVSATVDGLLVDETNARLFVRVSGEWATSEAWCSYALASGALESRLDPRSKIEPDMRLFLTLVARPVPGTALVLAQWAWNDFDAARYGTVFTLHDRDGEVRWRLDWPDDYTVAGDEEASERLLREIREQGAILDVAERRFTLRQVATRERVTFELRGVEGPPGGLEVREVARAPFESMPERPPSAEPAAPAPASLELAHLRTIVVGEEAPASPIHGVSSFGIDGRGRLGLVCRYRDDARFVLVDGDGRVLGSRELPRPEARQSLGFLTAWSSGERWVVIGIDGSDEKDRAWWLDTDAWGLVPLESFSLSSVKSLARTGDGGFLVLGTSYRGGHFTTDLLCTGPDGERRWALSGDQWKPRDPASLFAEAVTVASDGRVVVLRHIPDSLGFFTAEGEFLRGVDLAAAWGRKPNYPVGIHADPSGGFVVHDFGGDPPIVRMDRGDRVTAGFEPHFADGRRFPIRGDVQVAPDGTLWTSDGESMLALDGAGVVQRVLGNAPDATKLADITALALGPGDRLYAADARTGAVHVFDARGTLEHVCRPDPSDFDSPIDSSRNLTVDEHGEVVLGDVRFDAAGTRLGKAEPLPAEIRGRIYPQPGGGCWVLARRALRLLRSDGTVARRIMRGADGTWFRALGSAALAPDGSIAVVELDAKGHTGRVHIFAADGTACGMRALPPSFLSCNSFAFDGVHLVFGLHDPDVPAGSAAAWIDADGRELRLALPRAAPWRPFFAAGGKELWLFDGERRVEVFALPR